jgi:hypothetical protein
MSAYHDLGAQNILVEGCNPVKRNILLSVVMTQKFSLISSLTIAKKQPLMWMFEEVWPYGTKRYVCFCHKLFTCVVDLLMLVPRLIIRLASSSDKLLV